MVRFGDGEEVTPDDLTLAERFLSPSPGSDWVPLVLIAVFSFGVLAMNRHTMAVHYAAQGMDAERIQEILGLSSLCQAEQYVSASTKGVFLRQEK